MIERWDGLPCGGCGRRHVANVAELEKATDACGCECCRGVLEEWIFDQIARAHPDLITIRAGRRIVTRAAFLECLRRMKAELAELEQIVGAQP